MPTAAGGWTWHRIALPAPGGVGDQDAHLMASLDHLRTVTNRLLWQQTSARSGKGARG